MPEDSAVRKVIDDMRCSKCDARPLMALGPSDIKLIAEDIGAAAGILTHPIMVRAMAINDEARKANTTKSLWLRGVVTHYAMSWGTGAVKNLPKGYAPLFTIPVKRINENDIWNAEPIALAEKMSTAVYLVSNKLTMICAPAECCRLTAWARDGTLKQEDQLFAMMTLVMNALKRCDLVSINDVENEDYYNEPHQAASQVLAQDAVQLANTTAVLPTVSERDRAANLGAPKRRALNAQLASAAHAYAPLLEDTAHPSALVDHTADPKEKLVNFAIADSMARVRHVEAELLKTAVVAAAREEYPSSSHNQFSSNKDEMAYNTAMQQLRRLFILEKLHGSSMEKDALTLLVEMRSDLERSSAISVGFSKSHEVGESMKMLLDNNSSSYLAKFQDEMVISASMAGGSTKKGTKGGGKGGRAHSIDKALSMAQADKHKDETQVRQAKVKTARAAVDKSEASPSKKSAIDCSLCDFPGHTADNCAFNPKSEAFGSKFGASIRDKYLRNNGSSPFPQNSRSEDSNSKGSKGHKGKGKGGKGSPKGWS
jgi:hypothetical protein